MPSAKVWRRVSGCALFERKTPRKPHYIHVALSVRVFVQGVINHKQIAVVKSIEDTFHRVGQIMPVGISIFAPLVARGIGPLREQTKIRYSSSFTKGVFTPSAATKAKGQGAYPQ